MQYFTKNCCELFLWRKVIWNWANEKVSGRWFGIHYAADWNLNHQFSRLIEHSSSPLTHTFAKSRTQNAGKYKQAKPKESGAKSPSNKKQLFFFFFFVRTLKVDQERARRQPARLPCETCCITSLSFCALLWNRRRAYLFIYPRAAAFNRLFVRALSQAHKRAQH